MIDESCFSAQSGFRHTTKVRACSSTVWPLTMPLRYWTLTPDVILTQNGHSTCLPLLWRLLGGARCTDTTCGSHMLMVASGSLLYLRLRQGVSSLSLSLHNLSTTLPRQSHLLLGSQSPVQFIRSRILLDGGTKIGLRRAGSRSVVRLSIERRKWSGRWPTRRGFRNRLGCFLPSRADGTRRHWNLRKARPELSIVSCPRHGRTGLLSDTGKSRHERNREYNSRETRGVHDGSFDMV